MNKKIEQIRVLNLQKIVEAKFGSWNKLSDSIDKNQGYMNGVKNEKRPFTEKLAREIEQKLGLETGYLDRTDDNINTVNYISDYSSVADKYAIDSREIENNGWKIEALRVMQVMDESMYPILQESTRVLIDTSQVNIESGKIYVIKIGEDIAIRRIIKQLGSEKYNAVPATINFITQVIELDEIEVIGKVVYKLGELIN